MAPVGGCGSVGLPYGRGFGFAAPLLPNSFPTPCGIPQLRLTESVIPQSAALESYRIINFRGKQKSTERSENRKPISDGSDIPLNSNKRSAGYTFFTSL